MSTNVILEPATEADVPLILSFILELAEYEKATPDQAPVTEALLRKNLFETPYAQVIIAYVVQQNDGSDDSSTQRKEPAGMALYFYNFSTWTGRPGLYLEDLFVREQYRGQGIGKRLLVQLAHIAKQKECARMEWVVLDWNEPSIQFYLSLGAKQMKEWIINRISGPALDKLAAVNM